MRCNSHCIPQRFARFKIPALYTVVTVLSPATAHIHLTLLTCTRVFSRSPILSFSRLSMPSHYPAPPQPLNTIPSCGDCCPDCFSRLERSRCSITAVVDLVQRWDAPLNGEGVAILLPMVLDIHNCLFSCGNPNRRESWKL